MHNGEVPTVGPERGPALRAARRGAGISLRNLAKQSGVSHTHIARFETGERPISLAKYQHLLHALGQSLPQDGAA